MKNPTDPEELANIFNKKHKEHMDDPLFHLIRSNTLKSTPVYANYFDNTTDFRPARERIFICGETLKGEDPSKYIRQKYGHHGPGVVIKIAVLIKMSSFWLEIMKSILMVTILHD